jgi:hypothetical protein
LDADTPPQEVKIARLFTDDDPLFERTAGEMVRRAQPMAAEPDLPDLTSLTRQQRRAMEREQRKASRAA